MSKSFSDTVSHIRLVQSKLRIIVEFLLLRAELHDVSKLNEPELSGYEGLSEAVKGLQYGTDEYRAAFEPFKAIIKHHYEYNDHHPEHFAGGVKEMNLLQIVEMAADWKAASMRNSDTLKPTLEASFKRFGIDDQLAEIIRNTVEALDW